LLNLTVWLVPLSPLIYHLVQYRNDTWVGIAMAWVSVAWLRLEELSFKARKTTRAALLALAFAAMNVLVLVRYNAFVALPIFAGLAWFAMARHGRWVGITTAAIFLASPFAIKFALEKVYQVNNVHASNMVLGLDLIGVCVEDESLRRFLPYTDRYLVPEFKKNYVIGYAGCMCGWSGLPLAVSTDYIAMGGECHQKLIEDYKSALRHCPWTLLTVKLKSLAQFLLDQGPIWYHAEISPNGLNLEPQSPRYQKARGLLLYISDFSHQDAILRLIYGRYPLWLVINMLALAFCGLMFVFNRKRSWAFLSLLFLAWLAYGASFAPATLGNCYRYLYPFVLMTQVSVSAVCWGLFVIKARQLAPLAAE
jgi:hypothetical protein